MISFKQYLKEECTCVKDLEKGLQKLSNHSYDSIDTLMKGVSKKHNMTGKELHNNFMDKHGKTPDDWIKEKYVKEDGMGGAAAVAGPTNAVSSGAIAGTGGKGGEPGVNLKKKKSPVMISITRRKVPNL